MHHIYPSNSLRFALKADAVFCGLTGGLHLLGGQFIASLLGLPSVLMVGTGVFLALYAGPLYYFGTGRTLIRPLVWVVIWGGFVWASIAVQKLVYDAFTPTSYGWYYMTIHLIVVIALAVAEWRGLLGSDNNTIEANRGRAFSEPG